MITPMFRPDNTAGFTGDDLDLLNTAAGELVRQGLDPSNAAAIVNNNWQPYANTVESLIEPYTLGARVEHNDVDTEYGVRCVASRREALLAAGRPTDLGE